MTAQEAMNHTEFAILQGRKVLVVEDDEALIQALKATLELHGAKVTCASDGQMARNIVGLDTFDLVISDIRMPFLSGIELLHVIKRLAGPPVILMTGFSEIAEAKEAFEMGAKGFLAKPFKQSEFLSTASSVIAANSKSIPPAPAYEMKDDQFIALRIEEFVSGKEIQYDIYIRLAEHRFVKVATGGESIGTDRIAVYKEKGLHFLYLSKADFARYLGFAFDLSTKVVQSTVIARNTKLKFLTQTSGLIMSSLYRDEMDKEKFIMATQLVENTISVMGGQPDVLELMSAMHAHSDTLYAHSVAVSLFAAMIGRQVGWKSPRTIARLAVCGLLHDIGKKELPTELLAKPRITLTSAEIQHLETHCTRGRIILEKIKGLPEEISVVAMQHHEDCRSQGYPLRLSKSRIAPFARVIAVANEYCNWAFPTPGHPGLEPQLAAHKLLVSGAGLLDEEYVMALQAIFKNPMKKATG